MFHDPALRTDHMQLLHQPRKRSEIPVFCTGNLPCKEHIRQTDERGKKLEPMEIAYVDVPEEFSGTVIQKLSERKGELQGMSTASDGTVRLEFHIPSRGLIGFRGEFLTSTKGTGIINTMFDGYAPYKGDFQYR